MPVHIDVTEVMSTARAVVWHTNIEWQHAIRRLREAKPGAFEYFYPRSHDETPDRVKLRVKARLYSALDWHDYRVRVDDNRAVVTKLGMRDSMRPYIGALGARKSSVVRRKREVRNEMDNMTKVGGSVIYTDGYRRDHDALVTAVWGPNCVNVVFVCGDSAKEDTYGRQIERETSVSRYDAVSNNFGRCFRDVGTVAAFVEHPQAK